jgi:S-DNA-T family DNA segregation ATPase FtsK/SpoIIIE
MAQTRKRAPAARKPAAKRAGGRGSSARARTRTRAKTRKSRSLGELFAVPRLPVLNQRERDILGLALVACGIFMGFVLYGSGGTTAGGRAGHALAVALGWTLGRARVLAPPAIAVGGGALLMRPVLPALRPLRAGGVCVFASVTLALAAGTLGLSSGPGREAQAWTSSHLQSHGGVAGQALYEVSHRLVQSVGVDILVVFLALTGVILLTGASLASAIRATGNGLVDTTRMVSRLGERDRAVADEAPPRRAARPPRASADEDFERDFHDAIQPPEPGPQELIVRATHVEAPSRDEALGHFGVEAKVIGTVSGPHVTRYELRSRRAQGRQGRAAEGRPRLRARDDRHPHPRADPRQAGGRRRGAEPHPIVTLGDVFDEPPPTGRR